IFNALVLAMVLYAYFRRLVLKPRLIPMSLDAALILGQIGLLMISHFGYHGAHGAISKDSFGPVSDAIAGALSGLDPQTLSVMSEASYWVHVATLLVFLNYLPYSKHIHILGSLPNIFFREFG